MTKIDFRRGFAKLRLRREQSVLARFAEPQQLKAIEDGLRLGKIYRRWVVLLVLPIGGNFVSRRKDLIKSIFTRRKQLYSHREV